jgi:hypothetical protein
MSDHLALIVVKGSFHLTGEQNPTPNVRQTPGSKLITKAVGACQQGRISISRT